MKRFIGRTALIALLVASTLGIGACSCEREDEATASSTRSERRAIKEGNGKYKSGKYQEAAKLYREALSSNPGSAEAEYNMGLTEVRLGQSAQNDSLRTQFAQESAKKFANIARKSEEKREVAQKSDYNLGNLSFGAEQYAQAITMYKEALRLNPNDEDARRNLRIAQKKLQQNHNQDQNQDKNKDQDKEENQDQQDQQEQQKQDQQPPKEQEINEQTADQILKAMENKENEIRARVMKQNNGEQSAGRDARSKRW